MKIRMPKLGTSMTEGVVVEWLAEEGARVEEGEQLYVLETDKTQQEVEAQASGVLRITSELEVTYDVGSELGEIVES